MLKDILQMLPFLHRRVIDSMERKSPFLCTMNHLGRVIGRGEVIPSQLRLHSTPLTRRRVFRFLETFVALRTVTRLTGHKETDGTTNRTQHHYPGHRDAGLEGGGEDERSEEEAKGGGTSVPLVLVLVRCVEG